MTLIFLPADVLSFETVTSFTAGQTQPSLNGQINACTTAIGVVVSGYIFNVVYIFYGTSRVYSPGISTVVTSSPVVSVVILDICRK